MRLQHLLGFVITVTACGSTKSGDQTSSGAVDTATTVDPTGEGFTPSCPEPIAGTSSGPSEACPAHPVTDACCCFAVRVDSWTTESVCGIHELCPTIELDCPEPYLDCDPGLLTIADEAPLDCALAALADGTLGRVSWKITGGRGFAVTDVSLDLVGDGTVFRQASEHEDYAAEVHDVTRHPLPPPAYFADCLASPSWLSRFQCVQQATSCAALETCLKGFRCTLGIDCPNTPPSE